MDTLLLFRDTTCSNVVVLGETVPTKVIKVVDSCQSCANGTPTNCNDLGIAISVCVALVTVALITKCAILSWKKASISSVAIERKAKELKDRDESFRKQKSDLIGKLLDFLKTQTEKNDDGGAKPKGYHLTMDKQRVLELLKDNAAKSYSVDLRQQYITLCVEILHNLKEQQNSDGSSGNQKTQKEASAKNYIRVLCYLIERFQKNSPYEINIEQLMKYCGVQESASVHKPKSVEESTSFEEQCNSTYHEEKES